MNKSQSYFTKSYRLNLEINVTDQIYAPRGFLSDPKYEVLEFLTNSERDSLMEGFIKYLVESYQIMVRDSIKDQYYRNRWEPLSKNYLEFKKSHGLSTNIWEATGELLNSITYYKVNDIKYLIGISPNARYKDGTSILFIARCMEYGTKNMPARPLFRPILRYLRRNIRIYWELYLIDPNEYVSQVLVNKLKKLKREGLWIF